MNLMKRILFILMAVLSSGFLIAQKQLQVKGQKFEINAVRNNLPVHVESNDVGIVINYKTGDFLARIDLSDTRLFTGDEAEEDRFPGDEILKITGMIPINEIIDNQAEQQEYVFDLDINYISNVVPAAFKFNVTKVPNTSRGFNIITMTTKTSFTDFGVEDLKGYEDEIEVVLYFQVYVLGSYE